MKRIVVAVLLILFVSAATALPISYTLSGYMTGSLGENNFSNAAFELNIDSDTDRIWVWVNSEPGWPIYESFSNPGEASIHIEGIGSTVFAQPLLLFSRWGDPYTYIEHVLILNGLDSFGSAPFVAENEALSGYDLSTNISASWTNIPGSIGFTDVPLQTAAGDLSFSSDTYSFNATLVPVPAATWLFGSALALLGWLGRRTD